MKKTIQLALIAAIASFAGQAALAHSVSKVSSGYAGDTHGLVLTNTSGNCVRTSSWNKDMATAGCDADLLPKMAAISPEPAPAAKPVLTPKIEKITLREDALFDNSKATLRPQGMAELDTLVTRINDKGVSLEEIYVSGHASSTGPENFNQILSERRAEAVKAYLAQKGIDPARIFAQGFGESKPIASNATADGRAQNRRVEVEIRAKRTTMTSN